MIKKILGLLTFIGLGISFVSASFDSAGYYYYSDVNSLSSNGDYGYIVDRYGNFNTNNTHVFYWDPVMDGVINRVSLGWIDGDLYFSQRYVAQSNNGGQDLVKTLQGFLQKWCIVPVSSRGGNGGILHNNCTYNKTLNDVKNAFSGFTQYAFEFNGSISPSFGGYSWSPFQYCLSDGINDYCVQCGVDGCSSGLTGSLNLNLGDFTNISSYGWDYSPFDNNFHGISFSSGNTQVINSDLDNTIRYYEQRFGWDINMCYVGTNDLTSPYGSNVYFELGSGKTIFDLYYSLYNTFGNNSFSNVGSFINVNLLNYASWFENLDNPEERLYMAYYNGPDTNISMIYTGFTFPFANKPVAQYFMTDLIYNDYLRESSQGIEIAYYCDLKLNYDSYKNGTKSFEETKNKIDSNIIDRIGLYVDRDLDNPNGYNIPGSGMWGNLINSGYGIPEDLSPSNLFNDFYGKVDSLFGSFSPFYSVGIIPWWILYPMIFLILFRILRH